MSAHGQQEITDPVEEMLKKTGCMELHYKVQECIAETQDWRKCQDVVQDFKKCMTKYQERKLAGQAFFKKIKPVQFARTKMVFVVRTDLQMGKGKIASQVAHAAILLYKDAVKKENPFLSTWLRWGQPKIVLKVDKDCYNSLEEVYRNALENNLTVCKVHDSGKTQVESGSLTVVGIGPNKVEDVDKITSQFKLL